MFVDQRAMQNIAKDILRISIRSNFMYDKLRSKTEKEMEDWICQALMVAATSGLSLDEIAHEIAQELRSLRNRFLRRLH